MAESLKQSDRNLSNVATAKGSRPATAHEISNTQESAEAEDTSEIVTESTAEESTADEVEDQNAEGAEDEEIDHSSETETISSDAEIEAQSEAETMPSETGAETQPGTETVLSETEAESQPEAETVPSDTEAESPSETETIPADAEMEVQGDAIMIITVNGTELTAVMEDNSSVIALMELLSDGPLTIGMSDYGDMEKVGPLGTSLPRNDESTTTEAGDLILYQGNSFVIYYSTNSWSFTRLGKIQDMTSDELKALLGDGDVSVTLSLPGQKN